MVICAVGVTVERVSHQAHDCSAQRGSSVLRQSVLHDCAEVEGKLVRRNILSKVVAVKNDVGPCGIDLSVYGLTANCSLATTFVAVQIVNGAAGSDDEDVLITERPQSGAHINVLENKAQWTAWCIANDTYLPRIVVSILRDENGRKRRSLVSKHPAHDKEGVVNPLHVLVQRGD